MVRELDIEAIDVALASQNPWHSSGSVPWWQNPQHERPLASALWRRLLSDASRCHHLVLGPRRVGKSTVLHQTAQKLIDAGVDPRRVWLARMDHPHLAVEDFGEVARWITKRAGATHEQPVYLLVDEIAHVDNWDLWLKTFFDDYWPVKILATSSGWGALRSRQVETGVGRWEEHHLPSCSLGEALTLTRGIVPFPEDANVPTAPTLEETLAQLPTGTGASREIEEARELLMVTGGFPDLMLRAGRELHEQAAGTGDTMAPRRDRGDVLGRHLEIARGALGEQLAGRGVLQDMPHTSGAQQPAQLQRLLFALAAQITGLLSAENLARKLQVARATVDRQVGYLEGAYLIFTLPNYSRNEGTSQRRGRKVYFWDGAVRNAVLERGKLPFDDSQDYGKLLENLAATALRSYAEVAGMSLYHWRRGDREVDFVLDGPHGPLAFEVASSVRHSHGGLHALAATHSEFADRCYLVAPRAQVFPATESRDGVGTIPLDALLLAASAQANLASAQRLEAAIRDIPFGLGGIG